MEKQIVALTEAGEAAPFSHEVAVLQQTAEQMASMIGKLAETVILLEGRTRAMEELMQQRVTITSGQAQQIVVAVRNRAMQICDKNALPYDVVGRNFRAAIWSAVKAEYAVASRHDLPAQYYRNALAFIEGWTSFALICRMRERVRG